MSINFEVIDGSREDVGENNTNCFACPELSAHKKDVFDTKRVLKHWLSDCIVGAKDEISYRVRIR